jgi:hypothetical protein
MKSIPGIGSGIIAFDDIKEFKRSPALTPFKNNFFLFPSIILINKLIKKRLINIALESRDILSRLFICSPETISIQINEKYNHFYNQNIFLNLIHTLFNNSNNSFRKIILNFWSKSIQILPEIYY